MDLKEITSEVDEEDDAGFDADLHRERAVALLEQLKKKSQRMRAARDKKERATSAGSGSGRSYPT